MLPKYRGIPAGTLANLEKDRKGQEGKPYIYTSHCGMQEVRYVDRDWWVHTPGTFSSSWCCHAGTTVYYCTPEYVGKVWESLKEEETAFIARAMA